MPGRRAVAIWGALALVAATPLLLAANSPLLAWRGPVHIGASFAGIAAFCLMPVHPLLAARALPGLTVARHGRLHRIVGSCVLVLIGLHVAGLWITSPPDVIDALTFTAPTVFSAWGVIAMWAAVAAAVAAGLRRALPNRTFRLTHTGLVAIVIVGTSLHAVMLYGLMGTVLKGALSALALASFAVAVFRLRTGRLLWKRPNRPQSRPNS